MMGEDWVWEEQAFNLSPLKDIGYLVCLGVSTVTKFVSFIHGFG